MPVSKPQATGTAKPKSKKLKTLNVIEVVREGRIFWQTDSKVPDTMQANLGFKSIDDGIFEVERPRSADLPNFGRSIEGFGFKVKRTEQQEVVSQVQISDDERSEGETKLQGYLDAKDAASVAKTASESARDELKDWMVDNAAPKDPAHPDARIAQIGGHKVHNSWVNGRQTTWDNRDHGPVAEWAAEEGCADELVQVVVHKTISYEAYEENGIPEGYEGSVAVNQDTYDWYVRIGAVPTPVHDAFEARGKGYYGVKVYETKELACTNCGAEVKKTQKFCGECGQPQK
jgi:hypothetical protein